MNRYKAHVNVKHCEWKVTYADESDFHYRAFTRNPAFVFDTIKGDFRNFLIELVHHRMSAVTGLTDDEYHAALVELAGCFKEVMAGFKTIHPDFEATKGISVHRFINRLEMMHPVGVRYLLEVLFPKDSRMIRISGGRYATELWSMQDERVCAKVVIPLFRGLPTDMTYRSKLINASNVIPAESMMLTLERICEIDDLDVFGHLRERANFILSDQNMLQAVRGVCAINYRK